MELNILPPDTTIGRLKCPQARVFLLTGSVGTPYYQDVMIGNKVFTLEITTEYDGPNDHYTYCEKQQFDPTISRFMNFGPSCSK